MTPDEFQKLPMQEQADAWDSMSDEERKRVRPPNPPPLHRPPLGPPQSPKPTPLLSLSQKKLERIRAATCYGVLRAWLRLIFWGVVVVLVLSAMGFISRAGGLQDGFLGTFVLVVCVGLSLALVGALAVYQASLLLIDIADAEIQRSEG